MITSISSDVLDSLDLFRKLSRLDSLPLIIHNGAHQARFVWADLSIAHSLDDPRLRRQHVAKCRHLRQSNLDRPSLAGAPHALRDYLPCSHVAVPRSPNQSVDERLGECLDLAVA
jgi:hypothetical protein